jgi:hypothetical protein
MIIAIVGKLGTGKDYIAQNIIMPILDSLNIRYIQCAFADQIKINAMTKNNVKYEDLYVKKTDETRKMLQTEGTEIGRLHDPDIWIKYLFNWITVHKKRGIQVFIISDMRFQNEFLRVRSEKCIIIKIVAPDRNRIRLILESKGELSKYLAIKSHISECDLDSFQDSQFDYIIHNDSHNILDILGIYNFICLSLCTLLCTV